MMKMHLNKVTLNFIKKNVFMVDEEIVLPDQFDSDLVYRVLAGIPLPLIVVEESQEGYIVLSGQEIVSLVKLFVNGGYAVQDHPLLGRFVGADVVGKTFYEFSEEVKERFLETQIIVAVFPTLQKLERIVLMQYLNNNNWAMGGDDTPVVSATMKVSDAAAEKVEEVLNKYLEHPFFEKVNIPNLNADVVLMMMMSSEAGTDYSFLAKDVAAFKEGLSEAPDIYKELDYLDTAFENKVAYLKKAHLPMLYVCAKDAVKENIAPEKFQAVMDAFFEANIPEYKKASDNAVSSKSNVNKRIRIMFDYYKGHVKR